MKATGIHFGKVLEYQLKAMTVDQEKESQRGELKKQGYVSDMGDCILSPSLGAWR